MSLVHDDPRPALPVPRGLVFAASGWIAVSWIIAIGVQPPLQPSSAVYTPAARMLLASMVIGGVVAWPLVRLSAGVNRRPIASALLDLATLVALFQIVVWPLRLVTSWPADRTLLLDLHGIAWLASIAGLLRDGDDAAPPRDRGLAWHMPHQWGASGPGIEPFTSYRRERWKLLFFHDGPRVELYDLDADLGETRDLARDRPEVVDRLLLELDEWMTATDADLSRDATTGATIARPATLVRPSTD